MRILFKSGEEQAVLMNDASGDQHHRLPHGTDWRRSRSESSVPADDMETSYVPTTAYLPGPHRRHHVRKIKIKYKEILFYKLLFFFFFFDFLAVPRLCGCVYIDWLFLGRRLGDTRRVDGSFMGWRKEEKPRALIPIYRGQEWQFGLCAPPTRSIVEEDIECREPASTSFFSLQHQKRESCGSEGG